MKYPTLRDTKHEKIEKLIATLPEGGEPILAIVADETKPSEDLWKTLSHFQSDLPGQLC